MDNKHASDQSSQSDSEGQLSPQEPLSSSEISVDISEPQRYLEFSLKDKKIKVMDECNPIFPQVYLKDISLHKKGPLEDKIYSKVNKYYQNIRRGNTLCQIYHPDQNNNTQQLYDLFFCRRGMKKFYDLEPDYLRVGANLSTHHRLMRRRIFEELDQDLETAGATYHLYCLFKENGEHCQISYVRVLDSWLFASKNVAILARTPQDLENHYHKQRFYWAKLIGAQFFRVLQKMTAAQQTNFKKDIEGFTLLGEHCGNEQHQHITKYDSVQIIFYGLVSNTGFDHCQPVDECRALLAKYALKMSNCNQAPALQDKNAIYSCMWHMLKQVAEGTIATQGEGSVMYVVAQRGQKQRTVAMCKLKTCEYLIHRKLREMLKLNVARKGMTANSCQKYKFQVEQLVKHYFKPPRTLDFYFQLGEMAFKECGNNAEISETYLRYKYVDFISQLEQTRKTSASAGQPGKRVIIVSLPRISNTLQKYCKSNNYEVDYTYRPGKPLTKTTVYILYMIPRLPQPIEDNCVFIVPTYSQQQIDQLVLQLQHCQDLTKSHLITFIKNQDKAKSILMLHQKIEAFRNTCKLAKLNFFEGQPAEQSLIQTLKSALRQEETQTTQQTPKAKQFLKHFVLPLLIPGSGKSTLARQILGNKSKYLWKKIDSDEIRRKLMEQKDKVDLDNQASNKRLFIQTKEQALNQFNQELLKEAVTRPESTECVFVDRIFSPYNIEEAVHLLLNSQKDYIRVHVLSQSYLQTKLNDKNYPYSLNYALTCLKRCLERSDHQTMPNDPYAVAKIVMKFYQMMGNFNYKALAKLEPHKIGFITLPLIPQNEQSACVNQVLKKKVEECLNLVDPGKQPKENTCFIELVEALYKFGEFKDCSDMQRYGQLFRTLETQIQNSQ